jgi:hypothetical protein
VKVLVEEATLCQTLHLRWMGEGVLTQGVSTVKVLVEEATLCQTLHLRWMGEGVLTQGVSTVKVMLVSAAHCRAHAHGLTVSESHGIRYIASYVVSLLPTTGCESKPTPGRIAGRGGLSDSQAPRTNANINQSPPPSSVTCLDRRTHHGAGCSQRHAAVGTTPVGHAVTPAQILVTRAVFAAPVGAFALECRRCSPPFPPLPSELSQHTRTVHRLLSRTDLANKSDTGFRERKFQSRCIYSTPLYISTHRDPVPVRLCTEVGSCGHVQASGVAPAASTVRTVHVSWHVSCCNSTALCSTQKLVPFNKRRAKAHDRDGLASALSQVARSAVTRASIAEVLKTPVWISLASPLRPARAPCWGVWFHVPASKLKERRLIASSPPLTALRRSRIETTTPALVEKCASPQAVC